MMSNQNTESKCSIVRSSAISTARLAHEFLTAALHEHARTHHSVDSDLSSAPALYLMGHGIELTLKAYLISQGMMARDLRKLGPNGHDLMMAFDTAIRHGLDCKLSDEQGHLTALEVLNNRYSMKEFEYITTGATSWPRFSILSEVAGKLYNSMASSVGFRKTLAILPLE